MFQATQRRISEKIKSTLDSDALPFHEILDADMVESAMASEGVQFKEGKGTGEPALLRALLDGLAANEIVLGDRYFGSFFMLESRHSAHPPVIIHEFPAVPSSGRGSLDALGHRRPCAARLCRGN
jgi:hypothetical protein